MSLKKFSFCLYSYLLTFLLFLVGVFIFPKNADASGHHDFHVTFFAVQNILSELGIYNGPIDGIIGPGTQSAIRRYREINGISQGNQIDQDLLDHMGMGPLDADLIIANTPDWLPWSTVCRYEFPEGCNVDDLKPSRLKGMFVTWAGVPAEYSYKFNAYRIQVTWNSNESPYKCGQVISEPIQIDELTDMNFRSIVMYKC